MKVVTAPYSEWRVGRTVALNVYEGDRPICQCHRVEDAERIVGAMNAFEQQKAKAEK